MSDNEISTPMKHRSPAYPSFGLRTAVTKARLFYDAQKRNSVHVDVAVETLAYKVKSGSGSRAVAALISFGIMEEVGVGENRKVKLTPLGIKMLLMPEDDPDHIEALREAAKKPTIYAEMLKHWPDGLPSDGAISKHLTFEKNFNPEIVHLLIREFRDTYAYAKLADNGIMSKSDADINEKHYGPADGEKQEETDLFSIPPVEGFSCAGNGAEQVTPPTGSRILTIPITGGRTVLLNTPNNISEDDFKFIQTYLRLMKDAIVTGKVNSSDAATLRNTEEE